MISVVICSRNAQAAESVRRNALRTAGLPEQAFSDIEVIIEENTSNPQGICSVYNRAAQKSRGDILVFMHEDVFYLEFGWAEKLIAKFNRHSDLGIVGVAGTQVLKGDPPLWTWAGQPYLAGKVVHELDLGQRFFMTVFGSDRGDREVVAVDGLWMAVRRKAWEEHPFDETNFKKFHFYDLDLCLQLYGHYRVVVTSEILVKHLSGGGFGEVWKSEASIFKNKWAHLLPVAVSGVNVPSVAGPHFFNVDLKGKVPQGTIQ